MPIVISSNEIRPFVYSDVNEAFTADQFGLIVKDIDAINGQIINIMNTTPGDRIFEPEFGSNILSYLFDPEDPLTAHKIEIELKSALRRWMPRIVVDLGQTKVLDIPGERAFDCRIAYTVIDLSVRAGLQLNLTGV